MIPKILFVILCFVGLFIVLLTSNLIAKIWLSVKLNKCLSKYEKLDYTEDEVLHLFKCKANQYCSDEYINDHIFKMVGYAVLFVIFRPMAWKLLAIWTCNGLLKEEN